MEIVYKFIKIKIKIDFKKVIIVCFEKYLLKNEIKKFLEN